MTVYIKLKHYSELLLWVFPMCRMKRVLFDPRKYQTFLYWKHSFSLAFETLVTLGYLWCRGKNTGKLSKPSCMRNVSHCSINLSISIQEVTVYFFWRQQTEYGRAGSSGCILLTWRVSYCPGASCVCPDFLEELHCLHVSVSPFSS